MALYLPAQRIKLAVDRLRQAGTRERLNEFLILKRAIQRGGEPVSLSQKSEPWVDAIDEFAARFPNDPERTAKDRLSYYNVFGTGREREKGFRSSKYRSNGTADTVTGSAWSAVVAIVPNAKPRAVGLQADYESNLRKFFLTDPDERPLIEDAAVWFFRASDISDLAEDSLQETEKKLVSRFVEIVGLTASEREVLFRTTLAEEHNGAA